MHALSLLPIVMGLLPSVLAHGYVDKIIVGGQTYTGWQVWSDPYQTPTPQRFTRRILDNGPVPNFEGIDITCNVGGNIPTNNTIPVTAGQQVKIQWDQWGSSHSGPVMNYLAPCGPAGCSTFKGDSGNVWVKFDQMAYDTTKSPPWGSDYLAQVNGASWTVTIPKNIPNGEYILRHEILGLHVASTKMGAQFYPSCIQIKVTGGTGSSFPTGVALPGAYRADDTNGVLVNLWQINVGQKQYIAPGGPVINI